MDPITVALGLGKVLIERIWPNPAEQARELRKLEELAQAGNLAKLNAHVELMKGQLEINKIEAGHKSLFVAGWRPAVGWSGILGLVYAAVVHPLLLWAWSMMSIWVDIPEGVVPPPDVNVETLVALLTGMLGIGTMRSYDKKINKNTDSIGG